MHASGRRKIGGNYKISRSFQFYDVATNRNRFSSLNNETNHRFINRRELMFRHLTLDGEDSGQFSGCRRGGSLISQTSDFV